MAELITIARPYAKAIFAQAEATKSAEAWSDFLNKAATLAADDSMVEIFKNPAVKRSEKSAIVADLLAGSLANGAKELLDTLAYFGRLPALPAIASEFEALKAQGQQALEVTVTSAFPLATEELALLESKLKAKYSGKSIRVETAVDQSLIGGFEIRSSDTVIDATVRGRLSKIAESLTA